MRIEKIQLASFVSTLIKESDFLFFISYKGLTVSQFTELRNNLYSVDARCHVLRNSLIRLAFANSKIDLPSHISFNGGTAAVFGDGDPSSAAKVIEKFGKESEAVGFKAAVLDGGVLDAVDAAQIAALPSKEVLIGQVLGVLQAPMVNLASVFNAKLSSLVYVLQAYTEKKEKSS